MRSCSITFDVLIPSLAIINLAQNVFEPRLFESIGEHMEIQERIHLEINALFDTKLDNTDD